MPRRERTEDRPSPLADPGPLGPSGYQPGGIAPAFDEPASGPLTPADGQPQSQGPAAGGGATDLNMGRTRTGTVYAGMIAFTLVLVALLIFILQNLQSVKISYLGFHGHLPVAVAMLLAAVGGALLVGLAAGARILQLRRVGRRHRKASA